MELLGQSDNKEQLRAWKDRGDPGREQWGYCPPDVTVAMMSTQQLCVPAWNLERNREIGAWVNQRAVGKKVRIRGSGEGREKVMGEGMLKTGCI